MAKEIRHKSARSSLSSSTYRDALSTKVLEPKIRSTAGSALSQKVSKALRSANTITQTFKPKNARK